MNINTNVNTNDQDVSAIAEYSKKLNDFLDMCRIDFDIINGTNGEKKDVSATAEHNYLSTKVNIIKQHIESNKTIIICHIVDIINHCCLYSHLDVIKLLYDINYDDIYIKSKITSNDIDGFFERGCISGNTDLVKWILNDLTLSKEVNINKIFNKTCMKGKIDIAKLLYSTFSENVTNNIFDNDHYVFKRVCKRNHILVGKWLCELYHDRYQIDVNLYKNPLTEYECDTICDYKIDGKSFNVEEEKVMEDTDVNSQCMICHREYNILLECKHMLCLQCFLNWYYKNDNIKKCVLCSFPITNNKVCYIDQ